MASVAYQNGMRDEAVERYDHWLDENNWGQSVNDVHARSLIKFNLLKEITKMATITQTQHPKMAEYQDLLYTHMIDM